jgi:hypothetical protein
MILSYDANPGRIEFSERTRIPSSGRNYSLLVEKNSLFLSLGKMALYLLIYLRKSRDGARFMRQNCQTSLYFPGEQGMGVRDGFADDCPHRQELAP